MSEPPEQPPHPPVRLDYATPEPANVLGSQFFGGMILAATAILGAVFSGILFSIDSGGLGEFLLIAGGTLAGLIAVAALLQRSIRWRRLGIGLWAGIGLGLLIEGICFLATIG